MKLSPAELRESRIAGLIVVGLLLFIFETYIPRPIPWLKFGLANIATLIALYWLGWRVALTVAVFRIFAGAFFTGMLFSPGFFLSFSGGISATLIMIALFQWRAIGLITVSVAGALMHNIAQLFLAVYWLFGNPVLWYLLPYLLLTALITGSITGGFSYYLLQRLKQRPPTPI